MIKCFITNTFLNSKPSERFLEIHPDGKNQKWVVKEALPCRILGCVVAEAENCLVPEIGEIA